MLLKSEIAPVVDALLEAGADAHDAVFALVLAAAKTDGMYRTSARLDLLAGAQAIALAHQQRLDSLPDEVFSPSIERLDLDELERDLAVVR
jgi:hypothetical protein